MINVSVKSCREDKSAHVLCLIYIFLNFMFNIFLNKAFYEAMYKKYGRARQAADDNIIGRMRFSRFITKATDTHSEYVMLIAFPRQQWLYERPSMLRYTYIVFF